MMPAKGLAGCHPQRADWSSGAEELAAIPGQSVQMDETARSSDCKVGKRNLPPL